MARAATSSATPPQQGILAGLRVIEGSAFVAAPLGGMTLAQLGADVIRFDPIGGGLDSTRWPLKRESGTSMFWAGLNQGKRSIAVDIRDERGQALLTDLICAPGADAGLFVTNFPARGWLAYEALAAKRPDLIMVNLIGRRDGGSEVDYTVNPQIGFPVLTGPAHTDAPTNHVFPAWDSIAGNMIVTALLAALRRRDRTGEGQLVTLALKDVGLAMIGPTLLEFGNPPLGTQFITARAEAGLDWPVRLLVTQDDKGEVWAVNPKHETLGEHRCWPTLKSLPAAPDLTRILTDRISLTRAFWLIRHESDARLDRLNRFADQQKLEDAVLALLAALQFDNGRVWKRYDFAIMDALHAKGLIDNPRGRTESVYLTEEGMRRGGLLARSMFAEREARG